MKRKSPRMNLLLLVSMISTVLILLLLTMFLVLRAYRTSLVANVRTSGSRTVGQLTRIMEDYLSDIRENMDAISDVVSHDIVNREEYFDVFLQIRPEVIAVTTYDAEGNLLHCYSADHVINESFAAHTNLSFDASKINLYEEEYISAPHVVTLFEGYYPWVVTVIRPIHTVIGEAWIALDISCTNLSNDIDDVGIGDRGYCFLMDMDGNIVYHPQQQLIYSDLKEENVALISSLDDGVIEEGTSIYFVQTLKESTWRIIGVSYVQDVISNSVINMARALLVSAIGILLASLLLSAMVTNALTRPMRDLIQAMEAFEKDADHFSYQPVKGTREIEEVSQSFGHMVGKIQQLVETERNEEITLRKTELRALQAQINPHFLYNTLDSISWMCEQGKNAEAVEMVNALARLFRISISRGHELIPLADELKHAESYLQIQSVRYRGQFTYRFEVEESLLSYLCNKITLQPIIENAIYHGINGLVEEGEIIVKAAEAGDDILLSVEDNGMGMTEEQIDSIMKKAHSDKSGIGIKNVNDRLKIYFGDRYGITIDSVPDEGTRVHILMPKVTEEAAYENV
ncbi:MAG: sensor histidine kinase [Lachnospiraceae bacterium]|nr:sensor histidine kinase [Lachnospiraceae bacterium]